MRSLEGNHFWHLKGVQTWMHRDNRQDWVEPFTTEVMCRGRGRPPGPPGPGLMIRSVSPPSPPPRHPGRLQSISPFPTRTRVQVH